MLTVVAILRMQPGKGEIVETGFAQIAPEVRKEPGNRRYDLFRSASDPSTYLMWEEYVDKGAFEAHTASAPYKMAITILSPVFAAPPELHFYEDMQ